jgi:hypothetical protein
MFSCLFLPLIVHIEHTYDNRKLKAWRNICGLYVVCGNIQFQGSLGNYCSMNALIGH